MVNLVDQPTSRSDRLAMEKQMIRELLQQNDRRMIGKGGYFEKIPYVNRDANFYNRFIKGEKLNAGWVNRSDFEKENPADPPR